MELLNILTEKLHTDIDTGFLDSIYIKKDNNKYSLLEKYIPLEDLNVLVNLDNRKEVILNENKIKNSKIIENFYNKYININNKTVLTDKIIYQDNEKNIYHYTYMIYFCTMKKESFLSISLYKKDLISTIIKEKEIHKKEITWNF